MEFDIKKFMMKFLKYGWWISICTLLGLVVGITLSTFVLESKYQQTTQVLVIPNTNKELDSVQNTEIQANLQLINTYKALIKSPKVVSKVKKNLKLSQSVNQLKKQINPITDENSQIINIVVTSNNGQESAEISNEVAQDFITITKELVPSSQLEIIDKADASSAGTLVYPNKLNIGLIGTILGFLLSITVVLIVIIFSNKIKTDEDLIEASVPVLGKIGYIPKYKIKSRRRNK